MYEVIETAKEFRCFEDFDYRNSNQKRDFYRKWYHTRTRHPIVSIEEAQTYGSDDFISYEIHDESQDFENDLCEKIVIEQFKSKLTQKDIDILTMRMEGVPYEEVADKMGYKNHSGVIKRVKRIAEAYLDFCDKYDINY
jgi:hypothetical protein